MRLRLILFNYCNRNCKGCCNKQEAFKNPPVCENYRGYDEIILTGGEPMLSPGQTEYVARTIKRQTNAPIYLYTANVKYPNTIANWLQSNIINGLTVTLHEQIDLVYFEIFNRLLDLDSIRSSLRLNVFKGIKVPDYSYILNRWKVKKDIVWIDPCPLPEGEVLMKHIEADEIDKEFFKLKVGL